MALRPQVLGPWLRGLDASTDPYSDPKGSAPRLSNLIFTQRGALTDCDGSAVLNWFNGAIQTGRGRFMSLFLFQPTGVQPYYLVLAEALDAVLGAPKNMTVAAAAGGSLTSGQIYYYVVTALDGVGGETTISNEVSITPSGGNLSNALTWNTIPNAYGYNVYRGTAPGGELLLRLAASLPVKQPNPITGTVSFTDTGAGVTATATATVVSASRPACPVAQTRQYTYVLSGTNPFLIGQSVTVTGNSNAVFNQTFIVGAVSGNQVIEGFVFGPYAAASGTGGTMSSGAPPPSSDTTRQTVLILMPPSPYPSTWTDANIVAYFPATATTLGGNPSGGGQQNSTPSGGIAGLVSMIPQMRQFVNRVAIALGNGFSPQIFWDSSGTAVNPAPSSPLNAASVDAYGVVTVASTYALSVTNPAAPGFLPVGSNVILSGFANPLYNGVGVVLSVNTGSNQFTVRMLAAIGQAPTSGGTWTATTTPLINTFVPAYPSWAEDTSFAEGSIVQPLASPNGYYYIATQGGVSNTTTEPTWPTVIGQEIPDGSIIWTCQGTIQSSAPPPPGAGHLIVYAGSLWVWNTSPTNSASGLDGPTVLRMSDVDNPFSWNPLNQAFIDKDDGTEGMGLETFTISAQGIPPEGSLVAFKNYAGYQIAGVFGSTNFAIQRIRSDMGCIAPRTLKFVPGFGISRYVHLGIANFDGVSDTILSEPIRPYLFPTNDTVDADIVPVDATWIPIAGADLTANPPMYCVAAPVGASNGALSRIFSFDMILKACSVVDLPFTIASIYQARPVTAYPITLLGGYQDGLLQEWQNGDPAWLSNTASTALVNWSVRLPDVFGQSPDLKMQLRRYAIRGISNGATSFSLQLIVNGNLGLTKTYPIPSSGDFEVFSGWLKDGLRFAAIISGSGHIEIDRVIAHLTDKKLGTPNRVG